MESLEGTVQMRIVYIIASSTWGGGEQYVFDLARHLKEAEGVCPYFLFPPDSDWTMIKRFEEVGECKLFEYATKKWRFVPYAGRKLAALMDAWQADILHINSRQAYFQAVWAKRCAHQPFRLIATQHLVRQAKSGFLWQWIYRQIDMLVCVSQCICEEYLRPLKKGVFRDVRVVHHSVPISEEDVRWRKEQTTTQMLFHGRICREKGIEPLFKTLDLLADLSFRMVFAGNIDKRDQALWDTLYASSAVRDRIEYVGFCPDMHALLGECQIGISPSIVREAGPLVMFEQMAFGMAVVTSDNGSQPEIIQHEINGLLCPPNNPQVLADMLRRLLTDRKLRERLGKQAQHDFFTLHTYKQFLSEMFNLYCS